MADFEENAGVTYSIKELIEDLKSTLTGRLDKISNALETKASQLLVNEISQKVNLLSAMVPQNFVAEHTKLVIDNNLHQERQRNQEREIVDLKKEASDLRKEIEEERKKAISFKQLVWPAMMAFLSFVYTVFSIIDKIASSTH